jgi:hypothetical protein
MVYRRTRPVYTPLPPGAASVAWSSPGGRTAVASFYAENAA